MAVTLLRVYLAGQQVRPDDAQGVRRDFRARCLEYERAPLSPTCWKGFGSRGATDGLLRPGGGGGLAAELGHARLGQAEGHVLQLEVVLGCAYGGSTANFLMPTTRHFRPNLSSVPVTRTRLPSRWASHAPR